MKSRRGRINLRKEYDFVPGTNTSKKPQNNRIFGIISRPLPGGVMVARVPLEDEIGVRIPAGQHFGKLSALALGLSKYWQG